MGVIYMSDIELSALDDKLSLIEAESDINDTFGDIGLNQYQREVIKNVAEPYINKILRQTGKNFANVAIQFLTKGPGLTNFNIFHGVLDIIKEALSASFIDRIGEIYNKDFRFKKAYSSIMNQWKNRNANIDEDLIYIAENYDNATNDEKLLLRNTLNMVAILLSGKYAWLIVDELERFYGNSKVPALLRKLADDLNQKIDPSKDVTRQAANILLKFNKDYKILESGLRPISNLYFMISSAISLSSLGVEIPEEEKDVVKIGKYMINRTEFLDNFETNNSFINENIIKKKSLKDMDETDKQIRSAFLDLVDTVETDFDDKDKLREKLLKLENSIYQKIRDIPTGQYNLDAARNSNKLLTVFKGIS